MKKTYVLDTSALISNPSVYLSFTDANIIIPVAVLSELDKLKKQQGEAGKNARTAIRNLDKFSEGSPLHEGVELENNCHLSVDLTFRAGKELVAFGEPGYGDTQILACAVEHLKNHPEADVTLVTQDINLRVKAKFQGLSGEGVQVSKSVDELYSGIATIHDEELGEDLKRFSYIPLSSVDMELHPNECLFIKDGLENVIGMGRVHEDKIKSIRKVEAFGISSRNKEQAFAMDLMMDPKVDLVSLIGKAGSGKTLIAIACALQLVIEEKKYSKLIIYRPIQAVGAELGYAPGTIEEKLEPWFEPIMDSMETLFSSSEEKGKKQKNQMTTTWKAAFEQYQRKGMIELGAITFVRGRSIPKALILLDEGQNLSHNDIKTLLTRAGEGSKFILTGDIEQIDNGKLDSLSNGLTYVINKFKDSKLAGHVTLTQGERSRLATEAAEIL